MLNKEDVESVLKTIDDPEIGVDIFTLGLIYDSKIEEDKVTITLTFTSPTCPFGPQMVEEVKKKLRELGAKEVIVEITFSPPWKPSDELREMLGV
jgi:metal-sulfur cluster biosynthetic enzyme